MPPSRRSKRGGSFGGNLLVVPEPLPDDEPAEVTKQAAEEEQAPSEAEVATRETVGEMPGHVVPAELGPEAVIEVTELPEPVTPSDAEAVTGERVEGSKRRPPSTIRLDNKAGHPLFDAFLEAKQRDPFLSYRQFASGIVLDGLEAHQLRQERP